MSEPTEKQIEDALQFIQTLFEPGDLLLARPVESWTDEDGQKQSRVAYNHITYTRLGMRSPTGWKFVESQLVTLIRKLHTIGEEEKANIFFGVCPRFGGSGEFERAWQIRIARCVWADVDGVAPETAIAKCDENDIPSPHVVVRSGSGVHLYWKLDEPQVFDDYNGDPVPVKVEYGEPDEHGKRKSKKYFMEDGEKTYLTAATTPKLSPKAQHFQDVIQGMSTFFSGDHTHDLTRLLRLPGTMNRKNERNGERPKACEIWKV